MQVELRLSHTLSLTHKLHVELLHFACTGERMCVCVLGARLHFFSLPRPLAPSTHLHVRFLSPMPHRSSSFDRLYSACLSALPSVDRYARERLAMACTQQSPGKTHMRILTLRSDLRWHACTAGRRIHRAQHSRSHPRSLVRSLNRTRTRLAPPYDGMHAADAAG